LEALVKPLVGADSRLAQLVEEIRQVAGKRATIDVAQFQFITLDTVRAAYGARWPHAEARITEVARQYIAKRIAPEDVLIPGSDGFLVLFGSRTGAAADAAATRIKDELNGFFTGKAEPDRQIRFEATHQQAKVADLAPTLLRSAAAPARPAPADAALGRTGFLFAPVWDVRREVLNHFYVECCDAASAPVPGYDFEPAHDAAPASFVETDLKALVRSEEAIRTLFASGRKAMIGCSVHLSSLTHSHALPQILSTVAAFDRSLAPYRLLRIAAVPAGFPRMYLEEITRTLKARLPNIVIGLGGAEHDYASIARGPAVAFGLSIPPSLYGAPEVTTELAGWVRTAVEAANRQRKAFYVKGAFSAEAAQKLRGLGVHHLVSRKVWPSAPACEGVKPWPASELERLAKAA
jgi:hypothetical protein